MLMIAYAFIVMLIGFITTCPIFLAWRKFQIEYNFHFHLVIMMAHKIYYHHLTADLWTSCNDFWRTCNAFCCLCHLQSEGPHLLAGEAPSPSGSHGEQGAGGQRACADALWHDRVKRRVPAKKEDKQPEEVKGAEEVFALTPKSKEATMATYAGDYDVKKSLVNTMLKSTPGCLETKTRKLFTVGCTTKTHFSKLK